MAKEENIYSKYNTHEHGLSDAEAQKRLEENGKNIFPVGKQKMYYWYFWTNLNLQ